MGSNLAGRHLEKVAISEAVEELSADEDSGFDAERKVAAYRTFSLTLICGSANAAGKFKRVSARALIYQLLDLYLVSLNPLSTR